MLKDGAEGGARACPSGRFAPRNVRPGTSRSFGGPRALGHVHLPQPGHRLGDLAGPGLADLRARGRARSTSSRPVPGSIQWYGSGVEGVVQLAVRVDVTIHRRRPLGRGPPDLGVVAANSLQHLQQEGLDRRRRGPARRSAAPRRTRPGPRQQRPLDQELGPEQLQHCALALSWRPWRGRRSADGVVPLVQGLAGVDPLVALEPDQLAAEQGGRTLASWSSRRRPRPPGGAACRAVTTHGSNMSEPRRLAKDDSPPSASSSSSVDRMESTRRGRAYLMRLRTRSLEAIHKFQGHPTRPVPAPPEHSVQRRGGGTAAPPRCSDRRCASAGLPRSRTRSAKRFACVGERDERVTHRRANQPDRPQASSAPRPASRRPDRSTPSAPPDRRGRRRGLLRQPVHTQQQITTLSPPARLPQRRASACRTAFPPPPGAVPSPHQIVSRHSARSSPPDYHQPKVHSPSATISLIYSAPPSELPLSFFIGFSVEASVGSFIGTSVRRLHQLLIGSFPSSLALALPSSAYNGSSLRVATSSLHDGSDESDRLRPRGHSGPWTPALPPRRRPLFCSWPAHPNAIRDRQRRRAISKSSWLNLPTYVVGSRATEQDVDRTAHPYVSMSRFIIC